jgi:hypothetical protein
MEPSFLSCSKASQSSHHTRSAESSSENTIAFGIDAVFQSVQAVSICRFDSCCLHQNIFLDRSLYDIVDIAFPFLFVVAFVALVVIASAAVVVVVAVAVDTDTAASDIG